MDLSVENKDGITVIRLPGAPLDASVVGEFKRDIEPHLKSAKRLVFDLGKLSFIDSSGLGVLLTCQRQVRDGGGDLKLAAVLPQVRVVFELVRMQRVFDIHETVDGAIAAFVRG